MLRQARRARSILHHLSAAAYVAENTILENVYKWCTELPIRMRIPELFIILWNSQLTMRWPLWMSPV